MNLPYTFIVSGSGSLELKEKIHESLAGRKRMFELFPLSFEEFVAFKTKYKHANIDTEDNKLIHFFDLFKEEARQYLEEYLNWGGYPSVVLEEEISQKLAIIDEIYKSYLEKDISYLLNIQKTESLTQLVRILSNQAGNLVNVEELSNTLGIATQTIKNYLWYLEKTFIIQRVPPYFKNIRKEITKASTYYFVDLGLKNYASSQNSYALNTPLSISLFENFVFRSLREITYLSSSTIHFWRSKDKAEVDFVINMGERIIPVEVKYSNLKEPKITRSFRSFVEKYHPETAFIVHLGEQMSTSLGKTRIQFIPFYKCNIITKKNN